MQRSVLLASVVLSSLALGACSGAPADVGDGATGNGEDEVKTAECPASFTLELAKPAVYRRTPAKYYDGSPLSAGERGRVESAMVQARRFSKQTLSFELTQKANAKCSYESALSAAPSAPKAVLRGTSAKPIIDVSFGAFRYYALPKSYAPTGFTFTSNASAGVFSQVAASGPFSDGASLIVKIGNAKITNAPSTPSTGGSIADAVSELQSEAVLPGPGRNDDYVVTGSTSMEMVKSYIREKYAGDEELGAGYTFQDNARTLLADEQVAGTLASDVAVAESLRSIRAWYEGQDGGAQMAKVKAAFDKLVAAGAKFGFDGFEQNFCAAPTSFLLVIDAPNRRVYGVDLNPCDE